MARFFSAFDFLSCFLLHEEAVDPYLQRHPYTFEVQERVMPGATQRAPLLLRFTALFLISSTYIILYYIILYYIIFCVVLKTKNLTVKFERNIKYVPESQTSLIQRTWFTH